MALRLFMPVCLCTPTPPVCLSAPVTVFVCLWSCWNGTPTFCHRADFTETGLVLASREVFRLCIYASDDRSNLYHRLVIHVCLLCSVLIQMSSREAPSCPRLPPGIAFLQKSVHAGPSFISRPSSQLTEHAAVSIF